MDLTNGKVNFSVNNIDSFGLVINSQSNKSIKVENGSIILGISNNEGIKEDFKILFNKIEAEQPQDEQSILSLFNGADEIINYNSKTSIMKFYKDLAIKGILQLGEKTFFKKNGDYYDLYVE